MRQRAICSKVKPLAAGRLLQRITGLDSIALKLYIARLMNTIVFRWFSQGKVESYRLQPGRLLSLWIQGLLSGCSSHSPDFVNNWPLPIQAQGI
jgi:hypothetical protein